MRTMMQAGFLQLCRASPRKTLPPGIATGEARAHVSTVTVLTTDSPTLRNNCRIAPYRRVGHEPSGVIDGAMAPAIIRPDCQARETIYWAAPTPFPIAEIC